MLHYFSPVAVPVLTVQSTTATSISLSWTSAGSEDVSYVVNWQRDTSVGCTDEDTGSTTITGGSMTSYNITGLEEDSRYAVTVTASNSLGDEPSNQITAMTMMAREYFKLFNDVMHDCVSFQDPLQLQCQ